MFQENATDISNAELSAAWAAVEITSRFAVDETVNDVALLDALGEETYWYFSECLAQKFDNWRYEGLDGGFFSFVRVIASDTIEAVGNVILIRDQTLTAVHAQLRIEEPADGIAWMDLRLGELDIDSGKMIREPYNSERATKLRFQDVQDVEAMHWKFRVAID